MNTDEQKLLGLKIKRLREENNLTQEKLSERINIDITTISNIENGKNMPSFSTICNIIKYFKIEPNELLDFVAYDKTKDDVVDLTILEYLKGLSLETKTKIKELLETLN